MFKSIEKIFEGFKTPKVSQGYMPPYENNFEKYRNKVKMFCELGVNHGASLVAWKKYFPNAHIVGIENNLHAIQRFPNFAQKYLDNADDISIEIGDAMDKDFLNSVAKKYGGFDIMLDDCSHLGIQMKTSFEVLWKYTRLVYAVEDLQTQFMGNFKYIENGNFINYLQTLVKEQIYIENIRNDSRQFTSNREDISHINIENSVAFVYPKNLPPEVKKENNQDYELKSKPDILKKEAERVGRPISLEEDAANFSLKVFADGT